jgi:hypothetical protein
MFTWFFNFVFIFNIFIFFIDSRHFSFAFSHFSCGVALDIELGQQIPKKP